MAEYLIDNWGLPEWAAYLTAALVACALIIQVIAVGALVFIWLERKIAGRIQDRLGPTRVGGAYGWLQTLADGIKLIAKEDFTPGGADWVLFKFAPYLGFAAAFCALIAVPFGNGLVGLHLNIAIFFVLAVMGLEVFGVILAGYASGSKWSLFGAIREAAQVVSYEVPLGLCAVIPVLVVGSMDLTTIANFQRGLFTNWLIFHNPFTFIVFFAYFTCALASVNRAPFDLAEAESELVAGFHTEYSGLRWSYFFMAEYGSMMTVSLLAALLFFGGWHGPIPIVSLLGLSDLGAAGETNLDLFLAWLVSVVGLVNLIIKAVLGVIVMIWVRWTLPRLRIDQVISMCLKYCVPIAAVCFIGAVSWQIFQLPTSRMVLPPKNAAGEVIRSGMVRENWVKEPERQAKRLAKKKAAAAEADDKASSDAEPKPKKSHSAADRNTSGKTQAVALGGNN